MKAIIWTKYGPPEGLQLQEIEKPAPKENEMLVKVHATTVTAGDCEIRALKLAPYLRLPLRIFTGLIRPKRLTILGQEFAGEIEEVGLNVKRFKKGGRIFGTTGFGSGTYAEYICLPEVPGDMDGALALMPSTMNFEEAAAVPTGGLEALHFLRKANIQPGQKVLINGAGGSIGTIGVQLTKLYGAEVTAVDSGEKLDMLRKIGADHVVDYTREDFTRSGKSYDVIFDVVGKSPFSRSIKVLKENGVYLIANPKLSKMIRGVWISRRTSKKVYLDTSKHKKEDLIHLKELIEAGKIRTVIDKTYPLEEIVAAHHYVESGRKIGNLVIKVAEAEG